MGLPARPSPAPRVHRRADAAREPHQPLDRGSLPADQAVRRGVAGRRARHPLDQVVPPVLGRSGGHARLLHARARRADADGRVGSRGSALLRRGADQEPDRRVLRIARAQEGDGGPLTRVSTVRHARRRPSAEEALMMFGGGVDVGSTQTKAVIVDGTCQIVGRALIGTGANVSRAGERAFVEACKQAGLELEAVRYVVGTGYGRYKVTFGDAQITEITCHARGAHALFPATRTVIDMGGQDTKAIKVGPDGSVVDFSMNDKCAAGTGRFLSAAADVTGVSLDEIGSISLQATSPVRLTSVCTVFVESDIMSYLAQRKTIEDILGGVHKAIATRTMSLVRRVGVEDEVTFTGGVSRNTGMVQALAQVLGKPVNVSEDGHYMGALGAALFA